jgi:hypothetical protein
MIIVDVYPKGARSWHPFQRFMIKPGEFINEHCFSLVEPVIAEKAKTGKAASSSLTNSIRRYKSPRFTYKPVGLLQ